MNDARAAFKSGNPNIGLAKLQPAVSRAANAPHEDLQVARLLFTLACGFRNQRDTQALGQASGLALAKITNAEVKMNSADTTASYILAGELHDIIGNRAQAIAAYQQALSRNTNLGAARARLQQLIAIDANARERDAANALLRQRAATRR